MYRQPHFLVDVVGGPESGGFPKAGAVRPFQAAA